MRYKDFEEIAQSLEIKRNDIIMLHSDLSNFSGENWGSKCKIFYNYLIKYFKNEGTILVPAFSYSFCKSGYFDNLNSKSEVGIFDEFFRLQKDILRSGHPIFSFSCYGALKNEFVKNTSNSATGNGSIFEKFFSMRGKILFFGARFITSCTFLHFVEQANRISYRYSKIFKGDVKLNNKLIKQKDYEFFVRATEKLEFSEYKNNTKIEKDLFKNNILKIKKKNNLNISICDSHKLYFFVQNKLKNNKYYILDKPPKII